MSRRERPAKPALSREAVVGAALDILRTEGLGKVTMRRIAGALDTGPASLYVYFRDTEDLHAQVLDALLAPLPAPKASASWRKALVDLVERYLRVLMQYAEIARMTMTTHPSGPNYLRLVDTIVGLLTAGGADARAAAWGVDLVLAYATSMAVEHGGRGAENDGELAALSAAIASVDGATYPNIARVGSLLVSGEGLERFRWGLDALIDGILRDPKARTTGSRGA